MDNFLSTTDYLTLTQKDISDIKTNLVKEKGEVLINEIFDNFDEKNKNLKVKAISISNFISLIKEKVKNEIRKFLDIDEMEKYNIYNFGIIFENEKFDIFDILQEFADCKKIHLEPVMITNISNPYYLEFYWGDWNSFGKKEGFGISLSLEGNFYFGTFKNDEMHGLGIYAFADKGENQENKKISKERFLGNFFYCKQFFDIEKRKNDRTKIVKDYDIKILLKKFNDNYKNNNSNYFIFIGEFNKNKFNGIGDIHNSNKGKFSGEFISNKGNKDGKLTL